MSKEQKETLRVRLVSVGFTVLALAVFKPFGLRAGQWETYVHLLVIWALGCVVCMITEGILMPVGGLLMGLLLGWKLPGLVKEECEAGGIRFRAPRFFGICYRILIPLLLVLVLYTQVTSFFNL